MRKKITFLATILFAFILAASAHSAEIYVSPDAAGGGDGVPESPYTLDEAKEWVRENSSNLESDIYVYLLDGTYTLDSTFSLTSDDSGQNDYKVIYKAYDDAKPIISGGRQITGWELYDSTNNIYRAPAQGFESRQLYVNGTKAVRAKTDYTSDELANLKANLTTTSTGYSVNTNTYDLVPEIQKIFSFKNISDVEFVYQYTFHHSRMGAVSVDLTAEPKTLTMDNGFSNLGSNKGSIVWIENAYELLDKQGEWYLDKANDYVYYMPHDGEDMSKAEVIMPVLDKLISVNRGKNIEFDGLTFMYTTWLGVDQEKGYAAMQGGFAKGVDYVHDEYGDGMQYALYMYYADNVTVKNCGFKELGGGAVRADRGTKNCTITQNEVYNCAGGGIYVEEHRVSSAVSSYMLENNTISYNEVHDIGTEYYSTIGIFTAFGRNLLIENNEVYNTPYTGISTGWGWDDNGSDSKFKTDVINRDNKVYKNLVHDVMLKLYDGGGIYNLGTQPGMEIQNNVVYNVGTGTRDCYAYYFDDGSRFINMQNNIGYGASHSTVYVKGKYHHITDNYLARGNKNLFRGTISSTCVVENNTEVTDGIYPQDILNLAGVDIAKDEIKVSISGSTNPFKKVYYGLFDKAGIEVSEDIFYINETTANEEGIYTVNLTFDVDNLDDYAVNTSEDSFSSSILGGSDLVFEPYEFYDIYDAQIVQSSSADETTGEITVTSKNLVSVFSGRNTLRSTICLAAAVYDAQGKLIGFTSENYSQFSSGLFNVDLIKYTDAYKVKLMMWDSLGGMKPLTEFLPFSEA